MKDFQEIYQKFADDTTKVVGEVFEKLTKLQAESVCQILASGGRLSEVVELTRIMNAVIEKAGAEMEARINSK